MPMLTIICLAAERDARRNAPGHSLPHLLTFACDRHPAAEIRQTYEARLMSARLVLAVRGPRRVIGREV